MFLVAFVFVSGCQLAIFYFTAAKINPENGKDVICVKLSDSDKAAFVNIIAEVVGQYNIVQKECQITDAQPMFTNENENLNGAFREFALFCTKEPENAAESFVISIYEYKNYIVVQTHAVSGGRGFIKKAKTLNNELCQRLSKEYGEEQVVKWFGFDCPKGFFDK